MEMALNCLIIIGIVAWLIWFTRPAKSPVHLRVEKVRRSQRRKRISATEQPNKEIVRRQAIREALSGNKEAQRFLDAIGVEWR